MSEKLIAFHGKEEIKAEYIKRIELHKAADEIVQGKYWQDGKGCAVGCTIHSDQHNAYETELGIPRVLARIEDRIFETMSNKRAKDFPLQFLSAIRVGADLSKVFKKFVIATLTDEKIGIIQFAKTDELKKIITDVSDAYKRWLDTDVPKEEWIALIDRASADASASASASADADAYAYAYAYASADAYAYAYAYASADADAYAYADASADAYAYASASASAEWKRRRQERGAIQGDLLIQLLQEA